jgi:hypothetical protein
MEEKPMKQDKIGGRDLILYNERCIYDFSSVLSPQSSVLSPSHCWIQSWGNYHILSGHNPEFLFIVSVRNHLM